MKNIPEDRVLEIIRKGPTDIAGVMSGLVNGGFKYPTETKIAEEAPDPFIADLEATLNAMTADGRLSRNDETGKYVYAIPDLKAE